MSEKEKVGVLADAFAETVKDFPEIVYLGEPVLRTVTGEVSVEEGKQIGEHLGAILIRYHTKTGIGRGLAAPQIGLSKRVFVTYLEDKVQTYINPEIIWQSEETNFYRELCLSSGTMWADVERPEYIKIRWTDEEGLEHEETFDGFLARLIQHEYDHMEGMVNLDKAVTGTISLATDDPLKEQLRDKPLN